jgi:hypothetical protein
VKKGWLGLENFMPNVGTGTLLGNLLNALGGYQELVSRYN